MKKLLATLALCAFGLSIVGSASATTTKPNTDPSACRCLYWERGVCKMWDCN